MRRCKDVAPTLSEAVVTPNRLEAAALGQTAPEVGNQGERGQAEQIQHAPRNPERGQ